MEVSRTLDKVIPVRLPSDKWELLRIEATELGIGPTTLVRMWVLEKLRALKAVNNAAPAPTRTSRPRASATGKSTRTRR